MTSVFSLSSLLAPRRRLLAALVVVSLLAGLAEALFLVTVTQSAFAITEGVDRFTLFASLEVSVSVAAAAALLFVIARVMLSFSGGWWAARLNASTVALIRRRLASAFLSSSWAVQHGQRAGRLQELLTNFTNQGMFLVGGFTQALVAGCNLVVLLVVAVLVDPLSALALIVAVGLLGLLLRPFRGAIRRQSGRVARSGVEYAGALGEISQLGLEMHVFDVQDAAERQVSELIGRHERTTRRLDFLRASFPNLYTGVAYLALVGALAAVAAIETASLVSVGAVMLLMLRSLSYGLALQTSVTQMAAARPFLSVLDDEFRRYDNARVSDVGESVGSVGDVEVRGASFEYEHGVPVLTRVDATITSREIVGIVGPSGSGKSTLVQLLLGLRDPTDGAVLADGRDIRTLARSEWARKVTFVPQQAHLIAGTLSDNIRFYRENVSQADIEQAAKLANLHDDVMGWDEGYERPVGEQGSHLSGGQQQRLIIARALVENPELLILDEPTSALDVRSEHLIRETLDSLRDRMTIVIIAHRLSTLNICDRIMVIQDGEMKVFDTPERLAETSDFYREALRLSGIR